MISLSLQSLFAVRVYNSRERERERGNKTEMQREMTSTFAVLEYLNVWSSLSLLLVIVTCLWLSGGAGCNVTVCFQDAGYGEKSLFAPEEDNEEDTQTKIDDEVLPKKNRSVIVFALLLLLVFVFKQQQKKKKKASCPLPLTKP